MDLVKGQVYACTVERVVQNGVVVKMSDGLTEFIHISKLSDKYVGDITTYAPIGATWKVTPIYNMKFNKLELSHRTSDLKAADVPARVDVHSVPKRDSLMNMKKEPKSLDAMIAAADKVLADKQSSKKNDRSYSRRKRRK